MFPSNPCMQLHFAHCIWKNGRQEKICLILKKKLLNFIDIVLYVYIYQDTRHRVCTLSALCTFSTRSGQGPHPVRTVSAVQGSGTGSGNKNSGLERVNCPL